MITLAFNEALIV